MPALPAAWPEGTNRYSESLARQMRPYLLADSMAERVGFVPVDDASFNNLGLNLIGRNSKNTQNPGSRYKTGTVICGWETHPRGGRFANSGSPAWPDQRRSSAGQPLATTQDLSGATLHDDPDCAVGLINWPLRFATTIDGIKRWQDLCDAGDGVIRRRRRIPGHRFGGLPLVRQTRNLYGCN